jgi:hypothetical protein
VVWLVLGIAGIIADWGAAFIVLALAAGVMSAAVVVKADVLVRKAQHVQ